jgi:thiaminase/transcriptional activator TenA
MTFTDDLRDAAAPTWEPQARHPFVLAFADGSLTAGKFSFYIRQDYVFLVDYARVFAGCAAYAPTVELLTRFAEMTKETTEGEMRLHRAYARDIGIPESELEATAPGPATQEYGEFLRGLVRSGSFSELLASFLPCYWSYAELARGIAAVGPPADDRVGRWLETYASDEWGETLTWLRDLLDEESAGLGVEQLQRVTRAFTTASRHDLSFWDMCWEADESS